MWIIIFSSCRHLTFYAWSLFYKESHTIKDKGVGSYVKTNNINIVTLTLLMSRLTVIVGIDILLPLLLMVKESWSLGWMDLFKELNQWRDEYTTILNGYERIEKINKLLLLEGMSSICYFKNLKISSMIGNSNFISTYSILYTLFWMT